MPPPPGDDAPVPTVGTTERQVGPRRWRTVEITFQPTVGDQQLATGKTDGQGRAQLVISPGRLISRAGVLTTTTIVEDLQTGEIISSSTQRRTIAEQRPDVYFLLESANRPAVDTRTQSGGFVINFNSKRWGTAEQPLAFRVPRPAPVLEG